MYPPVFACQVTAEIDAKDYIRDAYGEDSEFLNIYVERRRIKSRARIEKEFARR